MPDVDELLSRLPSLVASGRLATALALVNAELARSDGDGRLFQVAGLLDHAAGRFVSSRQKLETALVLVPLRPASWCGLADSYRRTGQMEDARSIYSHIATLCDSSVDLLRMCASRLDGMGEACRALEVARRAVGIQRDSAQVVYEFGYYLARAGHPPHLVVSIMEQAVALAPQAAVYRVGLAKVLAGLGHNVDALHCVRDLSARQLDQIACPCCLERLAELFESGNDWIRAHACRVRIERLPSEPQQTVAFDPLLLVKEFFAGLTGTANVRASQESLPV